MYPAIAVGTCLILSATWLSVATTEVAVTTEVAAEDARGVGVERARLLGITPEMLAVHGAVAAQAVAVVNTLLAQDWSVTDAIAARLATDHAALRLAQDRYMKSRDADSRAAVQRLQAEVEAGRLSLESAHAAHRNEALAVLGDGVGGRVAKARGRAAAGVDPASSVLDQDDRGLQLLILAEKAEERAQRLREPVPDWAADVLAGVRSDPAVRAAQAGLETHLASIRAVFEVR